MAINGKVQPGTAASETAKPWTVESVLDFYMGEGRAGFRASIDHNGQPSPNFLLNPFLQAGIHFRKLRERLGMDYSAELDRRLDFESHITRELIDASLGNTTPGQSRLEDLAGQHVKDLNYFDVQVQQLQGIHVKRPLNDRHNRLLWQLKLIVTYAAHLYDPELRDAFLARVNEGKISERDRLNAVRETLALAANSLNKGYRARQYGQEVSGKV